MYLLGGCDEREWAMVIFSRSEDFCRITGDEPVGWDMSVPDNLSEEEREELIESLLKGYEETCLVAKRYLEVSRGDRWIAGPYMTANKVALTAMLGRKAVMLQ